MIALSQNIPLSYRRRLEAFNQKPSYLHEAAYIIDRFTHVEGRILDVGCGIGSLLNTLMRQGKDVVGIDPSSDYSGETFSGAKNIVVRARGESLPFCDNTFDVVYLMHTFAHLENPLRALKEFYRVLKDDGMLLIVTPNKSYEKSIFLLKKTLQIIGVYEPDKTVMMHYTQESLEREVGTYFSIEESMTIGKWGCARLFLHARKNKGL